MELLKKKSGFEDAFFVIAVIFTIAIFILILSRVWGEVNPSLDAAITGALPANSGVNVTNTFSKITSTTLLFDKLLPFILIGLFAFVLIGTAMYMNNPIMIFVGIIVLAVAILLASIYANIYHQISQSDEFTSTTANFKVSDTFMQYLPSIILIMFIGITIGVIWSRGGSTNQL